MDKRNQGSAPEEISERIERYAKDIMSINFNCQWQVAISLIDALITRLVLVGESISDCDSDPHERRVIKVAGVDDDPLKIVTDVGERLYGIAMEPRLRQADATKPELSVV